MTMLGSSALRARFRSAARTPRRTLRLRLTLLFAGMFLVCGAALLAVTYTLVSHGITGGEGIALHGEGRGGIKTPPPTLSMPKAPPAVLPTPLPPPTLRMPKTPPRVLRVLESSAGQEFLRLVETQQRVEELHQLEIESAIALGIMAILSGLLGWVAAGRVLRPLRTITATTRDISATSLDKRLALQRPEDELKDLGDTIDALLARLEDSFTAQRAFVANASHELRTPLALSRAMLQFALADPQLTFTVLKATCQDVLDAGSDHEQLIEALLTLARSQQGIEHRDHINLAEVVDEVVGAARPPGTDEGIMVDTAPSPAWVSGDPRLIRQLVHNLVENALRHNTTDGNVRVTVEARALHTADSGQHRAACARRPDRSAAAAVPATETGPHRRQCRSRPRALDRPRDRHRTRRDNPDSTQRRWRPTRLRLLPAPRHTRATRPRHRRTRPTPAHRHVDTVNEPAGSAPTATMSWMDEGSKRGRNPGVTAAPVDRDEPHCSFCGKARRDVDTMVVRLRRPRSATNVSRSAPRS